VIYADFAPGHEAACDMEAKDLLGSSHPLARATRLFDAACTQILCGLAVLAVSLPFAASPVRRTELVMGSAMCAVGSGLVPVFWSIRRQRALAMIIRGDEELPVDELEPVRRRLRDGRRRAQLASSLEYMLHSAEQWHELPPRLRPPGKILLLLPLSDDVREIERLLRADGVSRVRGVALCEQLLTDGVTSPLYRGGEDALRRELGRIRFALDER
jgi:hypothetical protein